MNGSAKLTVARRTLFVATAIVTCLGCQASKTHVVQSQDSTRSKRPVAASNVPLKPTATPVTRSDSKTVHRVSYSQLEDNAPTPSSSEFDNSESNSGAAKLNVQTLQDLEAIAVDNNPTVRRLQQEAAAEWAKVGYVAKLPDPSVGAMFYTPPMNFEPDRQVAEVQVMQMIPWLGRLKAESQRAHLEALAAENMYQTERLRVVGDLRATWYKLYVLRKQVETTETDKGQLESLITTASARIATGDAQPGDVLMASLELSALEEQLISYRQQVAATTAELNRLVGRDSSTPISPPTEIARELPEWNHDLLRQIARESQPELNAARLRTAATRWGIEVARLKRRPDLTFGAGWVAMDAPGMMSPGAGRDSFTLGVTASIPIWYGKYDAMQSEASRQHAAAHASEDEVAQKLDALLLDLWEQARASQQTIDLYEKSILPQARQTLEADQKSLVNNTVTFDRVIRDYRTLLGLELGYHRALGQLATTLARIRQTVGVDILIAPEPELVEQPSG